MARKKKHPEHENLERWLVSYADFITLLFATFTALYAMSLSDSAKLKDIAEAIRDGFAQQSLLNGIQSVLQGKSPPTANPDPVSPRKGEGDGLLGKYKSMTYSPGEIERDNKVIRDLQQTLQSVNQSITSVNKLSPITDPPKTRGVELSVQERGIRVSFDSSLFFDPGSATLKDESRRIIDKVADKLRTLSLTNSIHVEGHTDDLPIFTAVFPSNWELSSARASTVVRYLIIRHGFDPTHMAAVGYANTRPITSNQTPEGRQRNRRIDIIIYGKLISRQIDPRGQFLTEQSVVKSADKPQEKIEILRSEDSNGSGQSESEPSHSIESKTH